METTRIPSSSSSSPTVTLQDGNFSPAVAPSEDYESWTVKQKIEDLLSFDPSRDIMPKHPEFASYYERALQEMFHQYISVVSPKLGPVFEFDNVKQFYQVFDAWGGYMGLRGFLYPDILVAMISLNALRCARAALEGGAPLRGRRVDPNRRHRLGFLPLHVAADNFNPDMVKLLFRYGASANIRTKGKDVIEGLLPLHVAVENASMHKYLEDNWVNGGHIVDLLLLLCLPEMKMFLDTTRLIAKHTDNIVGEVWNYIHEKKHAQAAILLLAAQKQLRHCFKKSSDKVSLNGFGVVKGHIDDALDALHLEELSMVKEGKNGRALKKLKEKKEALLAAHALTGTLHRVGEAGQTLLTAREVSLSGFDIIKSRIDEALDTLHHEELALANEGKNGKALKNLKDRKEALLTAHALVGIVHKAGEALEGYIQTHSEVHQKEIVEHVSSILKKNGISCGKGIDTRNLQCYQYRSGMLIDKSESQRVDSGETNEAGKSSSHKGDVKRILTKQRPKGLAMIELRDMFFPYWKSVLYSRLHTDIVPSCQPSRKDLLMDEASRSGTKSTCYPRTPNKSTGNLGSVGWAPLSSNYESRRMLCAVASISRKLFKRA